MQTESARRRSQLFGVTWTHRHRVVAESESAFQEVDFPVPLELMEVEVSGGIPRSLITDGEKYP